MGNNQGKNKNEESVDYGRLIPYGIYNDDTLDYDNKLLKKWIHARKVAPFYKGLNDLCELKELKKTMSEASDKSSSNPQHNSYSNRSLSLKLSASSKKEKEIHKDSYDYFYNDSLECPICFLIYPRNINYSNCCDQPICTECLIQIKHKPGTNTPPDCPFCAKENFSVLYCPSENPALCSTNTNQSTQKISNHKQAKPVAIVDLRPEPLKNVNVDLRAPLLMHPGRFLSLRPSRRQRSGDSEISDYFLTMQSMGVDLEELMVMEAIRASLLESEQANAAQTQDADTNNTTQIQDNSIVESMTSNPIESTTSNNSTLRDTSDIGSPSNNINSDDKSQHINEVSDNDVPPACET